MTGRRPQPTALRRAAGNPGKRARNHDEPVPPPGIPNCPRHLSATANTEWRRLVRSLYDMGVVTTVYRAALAAYCQVWGRWVEVEERLKKTPLLLKTPSGYIQQSPWLAVANRPMELIGKFMAELGITPAARSRIRVSPDALSDPGPSIIVLRSYSGGDGKGSTEGQSQPIAEIARRVVCSGEQDMRACARSRQN